MQVEFKKKALLTVLQAALVAGSFAAHAAEEAGTAPTPVTAPVQQKAPTAPAPSEEGSAGAKPEPQARFLVKKGSGGAKTVGTAPEVRLPEGPLGAAPGDIGVLLADGQPKAPESLNQAIAEAQKAAGQPLDHVQREINMPGLKKDDPSLKPFVLHTRNGVNEIVRMSSRLLNRVATPFKKPTVIDTSESTSKVIGSDVYFLPHGDQPIGLFIADSANTSQTVSLTVIPDNTIPGQNLIVKLEDLRTIKSLANVTDSEAQVLHPQANDYTSMVRSLLASAARGTVPGFSPVPLEGGVAQMGDMAIEPELTFAGSVADIYRYRLVNTSDKQIDLVETAFFREGVKAVSFFPHTSLQPKQVSYVFILADKPESAAQGASQ